MNAKKIWIPIIAVVAVVVTLIVIMGGVAFLLFWYRHNPQYIAYSTETEVPPQLTQWVEENVENFSNEEWLLSTGYSKAYDTIQEKDVYICSYTYEPTLDEFMKHFDDSYMTGYVYEYCDFQKGLPITSRGEYVRDFPIDTYWLFHMDEYRQTELWTYRYIFSQETGASIEIAIQICQLPQEEHHAKILEFIAEL